jgi:hypothetical protein
VASPSEHERGTIRVVTADWPIVVTEFPEKRVPDATLESALAELESVMKDAAAKRERLFSITDLTRMREMATASQRRVTADWMKRTANLSRVAFVGAAQVTPSAILRGIITAVFWFQPPPTPCVFVATMQEAMLKGMELLEAERVRLPARLVAYRDDAPAGRTSRR